MEHVCTYARRYVHSLSTPGTYRTSCFKTTHPPLLPTDINLVQPDDCPNDLLYTVGNVVQLLSNLDISKASGPDGVSASMLKNTASSISHIVTKLFNLPIQSGQIPTKCSCGVTELRMWASTWFSYGLWLVHGTVAHLENKLDITGYSSMNPTCWFQEYVRVTAIGELLSTWFCVNYKTKGQREAWEYGRVPGIILYRSHGHQQFQEEKPEWLGLGMNHITLRGGGGGRIPWLVHTKHTETFFVHFFSSQELVRRHCC